MKKLASLIGTSAAYCLFVVFLILISPFIIIAIIVMVGLDRYGKLWQKIRRDPVRKLEIEGLFDPDWMEVGDKDGYINGYKRVSDTIARLASAKKSQIEYEGFEVFDNPHAIVDWNDLKMSQTLTTDHAKIRLMHEFGVTKEQNGSLHVSEEEYDERHSSDGFPVLTVEVIEPKSLLRKERKLCFYDDIWAIVAVLRGDAKRTPQQLWAYIPEHKVWLVEYKINSSDYGYRSRFTNSHARQYWYDKRL